MKLDKLIKISDLRSIWPNEATDFTPWLAQDENLSLLSETIGIDIVLEEKESSVGNFSLDIFAKEEGSGRNIIIENQLEDTNHDHLGKLITYALGKDASLIIWIVKRARDEHRQAIEWLNANTSAHIGFYLLEIELWKIGDSKPAPKFNIVERPNDWAKTIKDKSELSERNISYYNYWEAFNAYAAKDSVFTSKFNLRNPQPQNWYDLALGTSKCHLCIDAKVQKRRTTIGVYISDDKDLFHQIEADKESIESLLGCNLVWKEATKATRFFAEREFDPADEASWESHFKWYCELAAKFKTVIKKYT